MLPMVHACRRESLKWKLILFLVASVHVSGREPRQAPTGYTLSRHRQWLHGLHLRKDFVEALIDFFLYEGTRSVLELGASTGRISRLLGAVGIDALAVEGNPSAFNATAPFDDLVSYQPRYPVAGPPRNSQVLWADITLYLPFDKRFDWIIVCGVMEHIAFLHEAMVLLNIHRHNTKGIILSWAPRGLASPLHVNPRNFEEVMALFVTLGYESDPAAQRQFFFPGVQSVTYDSYPHSEIAYVLRRKVPPGEEFAPAIRDEHAQTLQYVYGLLSHGQSIAHVPTPPSCCDFLEDMVALVKVSHFTACFDRDLFTFERCCSWNSAEVEILPCFPPDHAVTREECCSFNPQGGFISHAVRHAGPAVVLHHLEKAGGTATTAYLAQTLISELFVIREMDVMGVDLWGDNTFRIGLIREPCSYYISLYRWGLDAGNGHKLAHHLQNQGLGEFYAGGGSKSQFKRFLKHVLMADVSDGPASDRPCGLLSLRVWAQLLRPEVMKKVNPQHQHGEACAGIAPCPVPLGNFGRFLPAKILGECRRDLGGSRLAAFDCWLRMEHLEGDFKECMAKLQRRGAGFLKDWQQRVSDVGFVNKMPPVSCGDWYDDELAALVESSDGALVRRLGYSGRCCEPPSGASMPEYQI